MSTLPLSELSTSDLRTLHTTLTSIRHAQWIIQEQAELINLNFKPYLSVESSVPYLPAQATVVDQLARTYFLPIDDLYREVEAEKQLRARNEQLSRTNAGGAGDPPADDIPF
jgi:hypothetical protein